jgi:hypothetical protein
MHVSWTKWLIWLVVGMAACGAPARPDVDDDGEDDAEDLTTGAVSGAGGSAAQTGTGGPGGEGSGGVDPGVGGGSVVSLFAGSLVITEIMNNPAAATDEYGEWFEIHNTTDQVLDLQGAVIVHQLGGAETHVITGPLLAPPQAYLVLAANGDLALNGSISADYVYTDVNLHNATDYLAIETATGVLVDETTWDEASGLDPDGASRTLSPAHMSAGDNDDDTHFCEASTIIPASSDYGTPGAPNDSCS